GDLSTAIIGRRAGECELELLILLDPAGGPTDGLRPSGPPPTFPSPASGGGLGRGHCGRDAGGPDGMGDLPSGLDLLELGRLLLLDELLPLVPPERQR